MSSNGRVCACCFSGENPLQVGGLTCKFGPGIQTFIDRCFDILAVTFTVLLVLGFVVIKYVF